jgi:hypothetical protein
LVVNAGSVDLKRTASELILGAIINADRFNCIRAAGLIEETLIGKGNLADLQRAIAKSIATSPFKLAVQS